MISPLKIQTLMPMMPYAVIAFGVSIVDVRTQCVKRNATFTVPFGPRDFRAAQTASNVDTDTKRAHTHCVLNAALHSTAERHTALKLLGDALGDESSVHLWLAHFNDVEVKLGLS